jgi:hypothetical protein
MSDQERERRNRYAADLVDLGARIARIKDELEAEALRDGLDEGLDYIDTVIRALKDES